MLSVRKRLCLYSCLLNKLPQIRPDNPTASLALFGNRYARLKPILHKPFIHRIDCYSF